MNINEFFNKINSITLYHTTFIDIFMKEHPPTVGMYMIPMSAFLGNKKWRPGKVIYTFKDINLNIRWGIECALVYLQDYLNAIIENKELSKWNINAFGRISIEMANSMKINKMMQWDRRYNKCSVGESERTTLIKCAEYLEKIKMAFDIIELSVNKEYVSTGHTAAIPEYTIHDYALITGLKKFRITKKLVLDQIAIVPDRDFEFVEDIRMSAIMNRGLLSFENDHEFEINSLYGNLPEIRNFIDDMSNTEYNYKDIIKYINENNLAYYYIQPMDRIKTAMRHKLVLMKNGVHL